MNLHTTLRGNPRRLLRGLAAVAAVTGLVAGAASASAEDVFDNIDDPLPGNVASLGFAATSTSEFGTQIELAGTTRVDPVVTVGIAPSPARRAPGTAGTA